MQGQVRKKCIEYLIRVLKEHNNELDWTDSDFEYLVSCPYNGGGHPEYASNIFSTIYGVKLGENDKYEIEDVEFCVSVVKSVTLSAPFVLYVLCDIGLVP